MMSWDLIEQEQRTRVYLSGEISEVGLAGIMTSELTPLTQS